MAAVEPPDLTYTPQLPESIIHNGHVTDARAEAIAYAGQAHEEILPRARAKASWWAMAPE